MGRPGELDGQVAVVTGASRGIGAAVSCELAARGADVVLVGRSAQALHGVADKIALRRRAATALPIVCDVTDSAAVEAAAAVVMKRFGAVDLLVNNAGAAESRGAVLWDADIGEWWKVLEVNLLGPARMVRAFVPAMVGAGSGRVVNFTSMRGFVNTPTQTAYAASKAALTRLTEALSVSLQGSGVLAFSYSPGHVATGLARSMQDSDVTDSASWTPMDTAVRGVLEIAEGRLDRLAGRLLHARDLDLGVSGRIDELLAVDGRRSILSAAFDGDPVAEIPRRG